MNNQSTPKPKTTTTTSNFIASTKRPRASILASNTQTVTPGNPKVKRSRNNGKEPWRESILDGTYKNLNGNLLKRINLVKGPAAACLEGLLEINQVNEDGDEDESSQIGFKVDERRKRMFDAFEATKAAYLSSSLFLNAASLTSEHPSALLDPTSPLNNLIKLSNLTAFLYLVLASAPTMDETTGEIVSREKSSITLLKDAVKNFLGSVVPIDNAIHDGVLKMLVGLICQHYLATASFSRHPPSPSLFFSPDLASYFPNSSSSTSNSHLLSNRTNSLRFQAYCTEAANLISDTAGSQGALEKVWQWNQIVGEVRNYCEEVGRGLIDDEEKGIDLGLGEEEEREEGLEEEAMRAAEEEEEEEEEEVEVISTNRRRGRSRKPEVEVEVETTEMEVDDESEGEDDDDEEEEEGGEGEDSAEEEVEDTQESAREVEALLRSDGLALPESGEEDQEDSDDEQREEVEGQEYDEDMDRDSQDEEVEVKVNSSDEEEEEESDGDEQDSHMTQTQAQSLADSQNDTQISIEIQARTTARDLAKLIANSNAEEDSDLESESESEPEVKLSTTARKTANNLGRIVNDYSSSEDSQSETEREIEIQARELSRALPRSQIEDNKDEERDDEDTTLVPEVAKPATTLKFDANYRIRQVPVDPTQVKTNKFGPKANAVQIGWDDTQDSSERSQSQVAQSPLPNQSNLITTVAAAGTNAVKKPSLKGKGNAGMRLEPVVEIEVPAVERSRAIQTRPVEEEEEEDHQYFEDNYGGGGRSDEEERALSSGEEEEMASAASEALRRKAAKGKGKAVNDAFLDRDDGAQRTLLEGHRDDRDDWSNRNVVEAGEARKKKKKTQVQQQETSRPKSSQSAKARKENRASFVPTRAVSEEEDGMIGEQSDDSDDDDDETIRRNRLNRPTAKGGGASSSDSDDFAPRDRIPGPSVAAQNGWRRLKEKKRNMILSSNDSDDYRPHGGTKINNYQQGRNVSGGRIFWKPEEEALLLKEISEWGCEWAKINDRHGADGTISRRLKHRNPVSLKDKARNIKKAMMDAHQEVPHFLKDVSEIRKK